MNTCPVGIATQNKILIGALNPAEKQVRVYNYHKAVIHEVREVLAAMGLTEVNELTSEHIMHRDENGKLKNY
jgi:glutamate synthase domain-containing protein 2